MLVRPVARDDLDGALLQQVEADRATEFAGPVRRAASMIWSPVSSSTEAFRIISLPSIVA
jgi:hypothetical protein